jgi:uncharacterized Tic20 family protein
MTDDSATPPPLDPEPERPVPPAERAAEEQAAEPPPPPPPEVEAEPFDARAERGPTVDAPPPGGASEKVGGLPKDLGPVLCHLSPLLGWLLPIPGMWVIAPLLVWQWLKEDPATDDQGREAVNFQLNVLAWTLLLPFTCIGVLLLPVLWAAAVILSFIAAYRASEGERYRYPLTLRILKG